MKSRRNKQASMTQPFKEKVHSWAAKIRVKPEQVRVQKMTRKWASCSSNGWVSFSADLLREPLKFQDYVIVHELLHLKVPNHGKLFKSLLSAHLPGWKALTQNCQTCRPGEPVPEGTGLGSAMLKP
jgi:predicted metal-dependent hydrolase